MLALAAPGLVRVVCASAGLLKSCLQLPGQEEHLLSLSAS